MDTLCLYQIADTEEIPVVDFPLPETVSLCVQADRGSCYIAIDATQIQNEAQMRVHLSHELGHCITGSFYNRWAARDTRRRHENRANKWAVQCLLSEGDLDDAVADGYDEIWSLAEHFDVTEDFMRKAVCWYTHGNLDVEQYLNF